MYTSVSKSIFADDYLPEFYTPKMNKTNNQSLHVLYSEILSTL